jgi:hypothetical protein
VGKTLSDELKEGVGPRYQKMNNAIGTLLDDYSMVNFVPLDFTNDNSIKSLLIQIDLATQYGEESEVRTKEIELDNPELFE